MVKVEGGEGRSHLQRLPLRAVVDHEPGIVGVLGDQPVVAAQVDNQSAGISTEDDARTARVSWRRGVGGERAKSKKPSCDHTMANQETSRVKKLKRSRGFLNTNYQ